MNKNELYHYGVKGMRWGHHKYYTDSGSLNSLGKARQNYKTEKKNLKIAKKQAQANVDKADMGLLRAKAKYNAAKSKNPNVEILRSNQLWRYQTQPSQNTMACFVMP